MLVATSCMSTIHELIGKSYDAASTCVHILTLCKTEISNIFLCTIIPLRFPDLEYDANIPGK